MSQIQDLEAQKADLQKQVELRDQILKLSGNHDFRKVINEGFLRDEAARSIRMAGEPTLTAQEKSGLIEMALAAGHLQRYLSANVQMGNRAEETIHEIDATLEELRAEGAE